MTEHSELEELADFTEHYVDDASVFHIINQLKVAREQAEMTHQDIATMLGVTSSTITNWETGIRQPKITQLQAYARAVGLRLVLSLET